MEKTPWSSPQRCYPHPHRLRTVITFCVSRRRRKMYCGHASLCVCVCACVFVCLSVCLSATICPHYCTDPDVTWGSGRGCPLVVHYWADLQSVHRLRCYGYKLASISRYDDIVRTLGGVCALLAGDRGVMGGRSQNCAPHMGSGHGWLAGDWPSTGGSLNITVSAWTAGFQWWCSGDITRMQNVSKYMLVLALCPVFF